MHCSSSKSQYWHYVICSVLYGLILTICLVSFSLVKAQTIRYVKPVASGTADGSSWTNASADLQAIINASNDGDQVWVATGTYKPSSCTICGQADRNQSFSMKNGLTLYGGFVGTESVLSERPASVTQSQPSTSILSGDLGVSNERNDNSQHIIFNTNLNSTAVLDGFVVKEANLLYVSNELGQHGGGMHNQNSSPTVRNCFFTNNYGGFGTSGSGLYSDATSKPTVVNCTFDNNLCQDGAAIACRNITVANCSFTNNRGSGGGVFYSTSGADITSCTFSNNSGSQSSSGSSIGALNIGVGSIVSNCLFTANLSIGGGAALRALNATVTNCTFRGNLAISSGTGVPSAFGGAVIASGTTFINCSFTNNTVDGRIGSGGGAAIASGGSSFINCSFARNISNRSGGAVTGNEVSFVNCILWGNSPDGISTDLASSVNMTYTDSQDNTPGTGNFSLDPLFVDAPGDNLRLKACSPSLDKGENTVNISSTDLVGNPRLLRSIDLGAYEFQGTPLGLATITQPPSPVYSIPQGGTLSASVLTTGSVTSYQWYKNGVAITNHPSATTPTLTITPLTPADAGTYYVLITGTCNSVSSSKALVLVNTGMYSVKAGQWNDPSVWSENRVPAIGDVVRIKHVVSLPNNYQGQASQVSYDPGQKLLPGINSRIKLNQ